MLGAKAVISRSSLQRLGPRGSSCLLRLEKPFIMWMEKRFSSSRLHAAGFPLPDRLCQSESWLCRGVRVPGALLSSLGKRGWSHCWHGEEGPRRGPWGESWRNFFGLCLFSPVT